MSLDDEVGVLRRIPLFSKVEPSTLKLLAFTSERVVYSKGQELFHQGDPGDAAYVIIKGSADVLVDAPDGPVNGFRTIARTDGQAIGQQVGVDRD